MRLLTVRRDAASGNGAQRTAMRMPRAADNALRIAPRGTDQRDGRFGCPLVAVNEPKMGPRDQRTAGPFFVWRSSAGPLPRSPVSPRSPLADQAIRFAPCT